MLECFVLHTNKMLTFVLIAFLMCTSVLSDSLPNYINSCSRNNPNLNDCALKSARESMQQFAKGDPSRNLPPLDPLYVKEMTVYIPDKSGLQLIFKENYFRGLSNMNLLNLRFDLKKKIILADALVNMDVKNQYDLSGKIMMMPVKSDGDSSIILKNTTLHIRFWYEHVDGDDGEIHWKIVKYDIKYEMERAIFRLENLLGDKVIGDRVNTLLNELWREIVADVGPSVCNSLIEAVVKNLSVLLAQVPYAEMMPDT